MLKEAVRNFLNENHNLISKKLEHAATESFSVGESVDIEEEISVVLTTDFELKTIKHPRNENLSTEILYVLHSFECETYIVDFDDVRNFLTSKKAADFENSLLANVENLLQFEDDELDDFLELSNEEKLREISYYLNENYLVLDHFKQYDKKMYEDYLKSIYDGVDTSAMVELAMEQMFDNLYVFE